MSLSIVLNRKQLQAIHHHRVKSRPVYWGKAFNRSSVSIIKWEERFPRNNLLCFPTHKTLSLLEWKLLALTDGFCCSLYQVPEKPQLPHPLQCYVHNALCVSDSPLPHPPLFFSFSIETTSLNRSLMLHVCYLCLSH